MKQKLEAVKFGLAGGIITALCVVVTIIAGIFGLFPEYNSLIVSIYGFLGYGLNWIGVVLGAIYAFIDGFILTWIFALLYNKL